MARIRQPHRRIKLRGTQTGLQPDSFISKTNSNFPWKTGWLPNNIPFVFDFIVNSPYTQWPLHYTLVPTIASLRWQIDNIWGWKFLRGNTDFTFSGSYTDVARGPETRYFAFDYGIRRNFIPRNWRVVPYFECAGRRWKYQR